MLLLLWGGRDHQACSRDLLRDAGEFAGGADAGRTPHERVLLVRGQLLVAAAVVAATTSAVVHVV